MTRPGTYVSDRINKQKLLPAPEKKLCSYCNKPIRWYPGDHEWKHVKFCLHCRWDNIPNDVDNDFIGGV